MPGLDYVHWCYASLLATSRAAAYFSLCQGYCSIGKNGMKKIYIMQYFLWRPAKKKKKKKIEVRKRDRGETKEEITEQQGKYCSNGTDIRMLRGKQNYPGK